MESGLVPEIIKEKYITNTFLTIFAKTNNKMDDKDKELKELIAQRKKTRSAMETKDKAQLEEIAIETIIKYSLIQMQDIPTMMGMSKSTFYSTHELHELNAIKEALSYNKAKTCLKILKRWKEENSIFAYKLACSDEHREILNNRPIIVQNVAPSLPTVLNYTVGDSKSEALEREVYELKMEIEKLKK